MSLAETADQLAALIRQQWKPKPRSGVCSIRLNAEDDPQLAKLINTHLRVNAVPVPDADHLGETEPTVLDTLDPPLNLRGRPPTAIRARLPDLRRRHGAGRYRRHRGLTMPPCEEGAVSGCGCIMAPRSGRAATASTSPGRWTGHLTSSRPQAASVQNPAAPSADR